MQLSFLKRSSPYQLAVLIAGSSMGLGLVRELLVLGLLGFTKQNDTLQIYFSIFYTISLTIDALRLSCLNLAGTLSLRRLLLSASLATLPFAASIGLMMSYAAGGLDPSLLGITILGAYLNLLVALLVTYKQKAEAFLAAQLINVLPNFILIPGVVMIYYFSPRDLIAALVTLTAFIPAVQVLLLLALPKTLSLDSEKTPPSLVSSVFIFFYHFSSSLGEQLFQIITRSTFYKFGTGYLSLFSMVVRVYAALRFVLIDSYIGSRLASWKKELAEGQHPLLKLINSAPFALAAALFALTICLKTYNNLSYSAVQIIALLIVGFYFSTLVRIIYFKLNHLDKNIFLVLRFASYELGFAGLAFLLTQEFSQPILALLWVGYIAKPFLQLVFLRKSYEQLGVVE